MTRKRIVILWLFFAVLNTGHYWGGHPMPATRMPSLLGAVVLGVLVATVWAAATPFIFRLAEYLPFKRGHWFKPAVAHVAHMILWGLLTRIVVEVAIGVLTGGRPEGTDGLISSTLSFWNSAYWLIAFVAVVLESRAREQAAELQAAHANAAAAEAKLHALRAQLQPHFLFNALNTVAMAVRRSDRQEALAVVLDLSALLRTALQRTGTELVSLSEEVDFIKQYLEIEQIRFRDRLQIDWEIDPAAQDAAVPSMILQPLVENALRHGIGKSVAGGHIRLRIATANGRLNIVVEDDGPGFAEQWEAGVGLSNVQNRLALHFGERARLETASDGSGARVRLSIPYTRMNGHADVLAAHR